MKARIGMHCEELEAWFDRHVDGESRVPPRIFTTFEAPMQVDSLMPEPPSGSSSVGVFSSNWKSSY